MISKKELSALLHKLNIPVGEGEHFLDSQGKYPKVAYWEYLWSDTMASGKHYAEIVRYQVSFVSVRPRDTKLVELKRLINAEGLHPDIYHEYVKSGDTSQAKEQGVYHSYFYIDVAEELTDE